MAEDLELFQKAREKLVDQYVRPQVRDPRIVEAFRTVPRERFANVWLPDLAYADTALPIGEGQTISQPSLVAKMTDLLKLTPESKVLEIGAGSGYQAAILSRVAGEVYSIERIATLAGQAGKLLQELGYANVKVVVGDGAAGYPEFAPYDAVIATAAALEIPQPLVDQLKDGGRIVIPVGEAHGVQRLLVGEKKDGKLETSVAEYVRFVPFIGA